LRRNFFRSFSFEANLAFGILALRKLPRRALSPKQTCAVQLGGQIIDAETAIGRSTAGVHGDPSSKFWLEDEVLGSFESLLSGAVGRRAGHAVALKAPEARIAFGRIVSPRKRKAR
jgi:hypothetical protein